MVDSQNKISRRDTLKGIGAALGTGGSASLAGCAGVLDNNDTNTDSDDRSPQNSTKNGDNTDSEPQYNKVVKAPSEADLTDSKNYSFVAGIERSTDGETEFLPADNYEVKEAYIMRDPEVLDEPIFQSEIEVTEPVYGETEYVVESSYDGVEDIVREAGLYNNILDDLEISNGEADVPAELMLPGTNRLHLEIEYDTGEKSGEFTVDEQVQVEKSPEDSLSQAWVEDREMFQELRRMFRNGQELAGFANSGISWMDIVDDVEETVNEKYDMGSLGVEKRMEHVAEEWIDGAVDATNGSPSGQASEMGHTLEELVGVETTIITTQGHHTVLAYDRDSDKTYHVETSLGRADFPPGEATYPADNPEISPIWPEQGDQEGGAMTTMLYMGQLNPFMYGDSRRGFVGEETAITGMERFREGTDQQEMVDDMQSLNLSMILSPSMDFKVEGDIDEAEKSVEY